MVPIRRMPPFLTPPDADPDGPGVVVFLPEPPPQAPATSATVASRAAVRTARLIIDLPSPSVTLVLRDGPERRLVDGERSGVGIQRGPHAKRQGRQVLPVSQRELVQDWDTQPLEAKLQNVLQRLRP